jgi:flagellar hook-associated protein 3 FlgL
MIRGPDAQADKFLTDLARINRRIEAAQYQITSGRRINHVSDAPDDIPRLLEMRSELSMTGQVRTNLGRVQSEVDTAEQALQHAVTLMDRALTLGTQGASDMASSDQRATLSQEIGALMEQMANLASASSEGRYVFSGDADQFAPYTIDIGLDAPVSFYNGAASTREVMHPSGTLFAVAKTAQEIFDNGDPSKNVFQNLNTLRLALRDNDSDGIAQAMAAIRSAATHVTNMLAHYGITQNQVAEAVQFAYKQELRLKTQIGSVQDADLTASILELNRAKFQQETALSAQGRLRNLSLFDYLG